MEQGETIERLADKIDALRSENERLRVALKDMISGCQYGEYDAAALDRARDLLRSLGAYP